MTTEQILDTFDEPPPPLIAQACEAYFHDQPELLAHRQAHPDEKWAAYHGSKRIGIGRSQRELFAECIRRGIPQREFLVIGIDAAVQPIMEAEL